MKKSIPLKRDIKSNNNTSIGTAINVKIILFSLSISTCALSMERYTLPQPDNYTTHPFQPSTKPQVLYYGQGVSQAQVPPQAPFPPISHQVVYTYISPQELLSQLQPVLNQISLNQQLLLKPTSRGEQTTSRGN